jgi:hypothetical protein
LQQVIQAGEGAAAFTPQGVGFIEDGGISLISVPYFCLSLKY